MIVSTKNASVEIGATGINDIVQCVQTLLTTVKGSVVLDRDLGMSSDMVDQPLSDMSLVYKEVYETISKFEPRVDVKKVNIVVDNLNGKAEIEVDIDIPKEYWR